MSTKHNRIVADLINLIAESSLFKKYVFEARGCRR